MSSPVLIGSADSGCFTEAVSSWGVPPAVPRYWLVRGRSAAMILLRRVIGDTLRSQRLSQHRALREGSTGANVSLGYLSEIERGQKEASSELLASICDALDVPLSQVLRE